MLLAETGKPLLQHTFEGASQAKLPTSICIACDHQEIFEAAKKFGANVLMTDPAAKSGTDRVAEVAAKMENVDIFVNVQGDEPEMAGKAIDQVIQMLIDRPEANMATLCTPIRDRGQLGDPACVKVVFDKNGKALYFSRSMIPYPRAGITDELLRTTPPLYYLHLGIYAFRRDFLLSLTKLPPADTERTESLEQLRVLHHGHEILVGVTDHSSSGIDTAEDYRRFVERVETRRQHVPVVRE